MNATELATILDLHGKWRRGEDGGVRANLFNADLSNANLSNADLSNADLSNANLSNANLSNADLSNAYLSNADLFNADLPNANLSNAYLSNADLSNADLSNADLSNADLSNAYLSNARGGIRYATVGWSALGEAGRTWLCVSLLALEATATHPAREASTCYHCGCFHGTESELRARIADGPERFRASRLLAVDFLAARMREMEVK